MEIIHTPSVTNLCNVTLSLRVTLREEFSGSQDRQKQVFCLLSLPLSKKRPPTHGRPWGDCPALSPLCLSKVSSLGEEMNIHVELSLVNLCDNTKGYRSSTGWNSQQVNQLWAFPVRGQNTSLPSYLFFLFKNKNDLWVRCLCVTLKTPLCLHILS